MVGFLPKDKDDQKIRKSTVCLMYMRSSNPKQARRDDICSHTSRRVSGHQRSGYDSNDQVGVYPTARGYPGTSVPNPQRDRTATEQKPTARARTSRPTSGRRHRSARTDPRSDERAHTTQAKKNKRSPTKRRQKKRMTKRQTGLTRESPAHKENKRKKKHTSWLGRWPG